MDCKVDSVENLPTGDLSRSLKRASHQAVTGMLADSTIMHTLTSTSQKPAFSIVTPTYNEAENIQEFIEGVAASMKEVPYELIIVDDDSSDGTASIAKRLGGVYGNIKVLRRPGRLGLASAVKDGFGKAEADVLAVMDADLQHPPELLSKMYQKIREGYDMVVASRYVEGGGVEGWSPWRKLISKGATMLAHLTLPATRKVKDPVSGYFVVKKEVIDGVELNPSGFKILLEILTEGKYKSIVEIPYTFKPRKGGRSKFNLKEILSYVMFLLKLRLKH